MAPDPRKYEARLAALARAHERAAESIKKTPDLVEAFGQATALRDLLGKLEQDAKMLRSHVAAQIRRDDMINLSAVARRIGLTPQRLSQLAREARPRPAPQQLVAPEAALTAEPQPIVAAIITSDRGMLITYRHDKTPPAGFLTGEIEPGETAADAMVRECKEEAGLRVAPGPEIGRRIHPKTGRTMIYVAGTPIEHSDVIVGDREELTDVRWVSLAEADAAFAPFGGMFKPVHDHLLRHLASRD